MPLGQLDDVRLPLALSDLQRWSQTTGRGSAVTLDWVGLGSAVPLPLLPYHAHDWEFQPRMRFVLAEQP